MGQIILPKRFHAGFKHGLLPPNGSIKLDTSGLLGSTVTHAFLVGGRLRNVCGPQTVTVQGGGSLVGSQRGIVLQGSGSAQAGTVYLDLSQYTRLTLSFLLWWDSYANDYDMAMELQGSEGFFVSPNSGGGTQKFEAGVTSSMGNAAVEVTRPSAAAWHQIHICFNRASSGASTTEIYVDGVVQSESMTGLGDPIDAFGSADLSILGRNNTSLFGAGKISNIVIRGGTILPAAAISEEARYPYAAFSPANDAAYFLPSAGGGGATLTADSGSYSLTGTAATIAAGRKLTADAGTYSLTGTAATLAVGRKLTAESGTYSVTGTSVDFLRGYSLTAESGGYSVSGTDAAIKLGRLLAAESGSYTLTGTDVTLTYQQAGSYSLTADAGSYALTGTAAALRVTRTLTAEAGSYSLTGADVTLRRGYAVQADTGSYALTGAAVAFARTYVLGAESGSYTLTGSDVGLTWSAAPVVETPTHGGPSIYGKAVFREKEFRREYDEQIRRIDEAKLAERLIREDEELIIIMAALAA